MYVLQVCVLSQYAKCVLEYVVHVSDTTVSVHPMGMPCPQCAHSVHRKVLYIGKYSFTLPHFSHFVTTIPIVCLYAFSFGISDIRESNCSVVLLHPHVLLDVSSLHLLSVVFDTCARVVHP